MIYDVVIIGAGPSGSSAARTLAMGGLKVVVVDKQEFPREKLCGNLVSGFCLDVIGFHIPETIIRSQAMSCTVNCKYTTTLRFPEPVGSFIKRKELDDFLLGQAIAEGAEFRPKHRVTAIRGDDDGVSTVECDDGTRIRSRYVIGADGVRGYCSRHVRRGAFRKWKYGVAYGVEVPISAIDTSKFDDIYLDASFMNGGYAWIFIEGDTANIGAGSTLLFNKRIRKHFSSFLKTYVKDPSSVDDLSIRGHLLPIGGVGRRLTKGNVLLVGDAAGAVDAVSGEGIGFAILSGQMAAEAIMANLNSPKRVAKTYVDQFNKKILKQLRPLLFYSLLLFFLRPLFFSIRPRNSRELFELQVKAVAGKITHREFVFGALKRLPKILLRTLFDVIFRRP